MSIARPRLMCSGWTRVGLPSVTSYDAFISGSVLSALTRAQPTRWVNEILPPRARRRWLLMTIRLSISSLTGTWRTLVAVGTWRLVSMFCAVRAGAPRRIFRSASSVVAAAAGCAALGCAGFAGVGWFTVPPVGAAFWGTAACAGAGVAGDCVAGDCVAAAAAGAFEAGTVGVVPRLGASGVLLSDTGSGRGASAGGVVTGFASPSGLYVLKKSSHAGSTEFGSCWYFSYSSSTSHS